MAKPIQFKSPQFEFTAEITKVDRKKIYGYSKIGIEDANGSKCLLATLSDDGSHILPSGSTGIAKFDSNQNHIESANIKAVDLEGNPAEKVPSVFEIDVELKPVDNIQDYLDLNVKGIYQLAIEEESKVQLLSYLKENHLLSFVFNYRADYEGDDAFLIASIETVFAVVGNKCAFEFIGFQEIVEDNEEEDEDEDDDFDFGML